MKFNMVLSEDQKHNKKQRICTFNSKSLLSVFHLPPEHIKWDIIDLSKVRRKGEELLDLNGTVLYFKRGQKQHNSNWNTYRPKNGPNV